tara:strand:- start:3287 stop:4759 length:1473 start_codon:yes stop_codon:yes gene_type:complete
MKLQSEYINRKVEAQTRRHFLKECTTGMGMIAMGSMFGCSTDNTISQNDLINNIGNNLTQYAPKAKNVIFLHMAGAPSQLELFDYKPELEKLHDQPCPDSFMEGKRFAFISGKPKMLGPRAKFEQYGQSGAWVSDLLPEFSTVVDDVCFLKAMHTDEINHAPAQLFLHTGSPRMGRPSIGSWATYGLGSENDNLPGYLVLVSGGKTPSAGKSVWGSGFLPSMYQGVQCRSQGDPILFLSDPENVSRPLRKDIIDAINDINQEEYNVYQDPETLTRIEQYEMAYKMQISVPEVMDMSDEPNYIHESYGTDPGKESFANNCLLARKLVEKGVRYVQLFHWGWDAHGNAEEVSLDHGFKDRCKEIDKPMAALIKDLKQRGMLDETLIVWGGEFGRTPMQENRSGSDNNWSGRDHHIDAYTMWMAGGGVKAGHTHGSTDDFGYNGVNGRVHIHDLQATMLNQLGINHLDLTYPFQGRDFRLTDLFGNVVNEVIS